MPENYVTRENRPYDDNDYTAFALYNVAGERFGLNSGRSGEALKRKNPPYRRVSKYNMISEGITATAKAAR